jgi:hypothetical protein
VPPKDKPDGTDWDTQLREARRKAGKARWRNLTLGERKISVQKVQAARWANVPPEERSAAAKKAKATLGPEGIKAALKKMAETMGPEGRSAAVEKGNKTRGPEGRRAAALKAAATRRKRAAERAAVHAGAKGVVDAGQVRGNLSGISAVNIYMIYREIFPHWPQDPPSGLRIAVDSHTMNDAKETVYGEVSRQLPALGAVIATLNVPGIQAEPVATADMPGFLIDPGMDLTDSANQQFLHSAGIANTQYAQATALQDDLLRHYAGEDLQLPQAETPQDKAEDFLLETFGTDVPPLPPFPGQSTSPNANGSLTVLQWDPARTFILPRTAEASAPSFSVPNDTSRAHFAQSGFVQRQQSIPPAPSDPPSMQQVTESLIAHVISEQKKPAGRKR